MVGQLMLITHFHVLTEFLFCTSNSVHVVLEEMRKCPVKFKDLMESCVGDNAYDLQPGYTECK